LFIITFFNYVLCSAGARAFKVGGPNLKVGAPMFWF